ncbi:MAG: MFS transporter [Candidatus Thorarchaeota archaeon]
MGRVTSYFGLPEGKPKVLRLAAIFLGLFTSMTAVINISTTFYLIFVAEALGNGSYIDGLALAGVLIVVQKVVQTLLDYPTGTLGDMIGQRWVLASAFLTYSAAFYLVSLITPSSPFVLFLLAYILMGVAASQESGALSSWFDSNYTKAAPEDSDRLQYGVFIGKQAMLIRVARALVILPGAFLAVVIAYSFVFQVQAVTCVLIAIASIFLVRDISPKQELDQPEENEIRYISILKESAKYVFNSPYLKYLVLGNTLFMSIGFTWAEIIMYPFLYDYLITDTSVALLMTLVFLVFALLWERSGVWAKRFEPRKWLPRFRFVQSSGALFFFLFSILMLVFPPTLLTSEMTEVMIPLTGIVVLQIPTNSILPVLIILTIWFTLGVFFTTAAILWMRVLVDSIPNKIRNSVYSLLPTLVVLAAIPQVAIIGLLIPRYGIPIVLILSGVISAVGALFLRKGFALNLVD